MKRMRPARPEQPLVPNASSLAHITRAQDLERHLRDQQLADLHAVLDMPAGRRLLWRLLVEEGGFFRQTFREGHPDTSAFYEGKRSIALFLQAEIGAADPAAFERMRRERAEEDQTEQALRTALAMQAEEEDAGEEP